MTSDRLVTIIITTPPNIRDAVPSMKRSTSITGFCVCRASCNECVLRLSLKRVFVAASVSTRKCTGVFRKSRSKLRY